MIDLSNLQVKCSKPFDLRRERKEWWKYMRKYGPVSRDLIKHECPRTIKKYEKHVIGEM